MEEKQMNTVERVRGICKERKIPISRLEKECGFANGYISQLRKGSFPDDRLGKISEVLGLPVDYLRTGKEKELVLLLQVRSAYGRKDKRRNAQLGYSIQ
jgi:transcriptional regulator with XRE-family HTH domain